MNTPVTQAQVFFNAQEFFDKMVASHYEAPEWTDVNLLMSHYDNFKNIIAPGWLPTLRAEPHGPPYPTP